MPEPMMVLFLAVPFLPLLVALAVLWQMERTRRHNG